jgi:hypothetical protein
MFAQRPLVRSKNPCWHWQELVSMNPGLCSQYDPVRIDIGQRYSQVMDYKGKQYGKESW